MNVSQINWLLFKPLELNIFPRHDIAKASFVLFIWLDGNAVKDLTCLLTISYILHASDFRPHSA